MVRYIQFLTLSFAAMMVFSTHAFGCSCAPITAGKTIDELRSERRNFFLNEFTGAAFVGKVVKSNRVNVNWIAKTLDGEPTDSQMYRYTIRVNEYWLGVKSPTVVVYGEPAEQIYGKFSSIGSCGIKLDKGRTYFFTPHLYQGHLQIHQCDFAGGGSLPNGPKAIEFKRIMGESKQF